MAQATAPLFDSYQLMRRQLMLADLVCPLWSKSGQTIATQRLSALCQNRTHAAQQTPHMIGTIYSVIPCPFTSSGTL